MRILIVAVCVASVMTVISVLAEANDGVPARLAPKASNRLPASSLEPAQLSLSNEEKLPAELDGAEIEVSFSQDSEPEPHLLARGKGDRVLLFRIDPPKGRSLASVTAPSEVGASVMPVRSFEKRLQQAVDRDRFFTARQPKPKARCKDRYFVRIKFNGKERERRGCTNQSNDRFAALSQLFFRDAFMVWRQTSSD